MSLADDIRELARLSLANLDASHDYHTYSIRVWQLPGQMADEGRKFRFRNPSTGTAVDQHLLRRRADEYISDYLRPFTFQHFVSLFEDFFFDLLRLWLAAYPGSLSKKQLEFGTVLHAPDRTTIVLAVVDRELNELKYERLAEWFAYFERLAKLGCPTAAEIEQLAEIKASRDILVHNKGIVNAAYLWKSGGRARFSDGEPLEILERYHRESWELIRKFVRDVSDAAENKARA